MTKWIITKIAEPFPALFGHVSQKGHGPDDAEGPFYKAGVEFNTIYSKKNLAWKQSSAEYLRNLGWTVDVSVVDNWKPQHYG